MVPIFRGKHYRDDIYFIGSLIGKQDEYYIIEDKDMEYYRPIDITTIEMSFDNGKNWFNDFELIGLNMKSYKGIM